MVILYGYTILAYLVQSKKGPQEHTCKDFRVAQAHNIFGSLENKTRTNRIFKGANPKLVTDSIYARDLPKLYIKSRRSRRGGPILSTAYTPPRQITYVRQCNFRFRRNQEQTSRSRVFPLGS